MFTNCNIFGAKRGETLTYKKYYFSFITIFLGNLGDGETADSDFFSTLADFSMAATDMLNIDHIFV
jgi:hypothetical protein